MIVIDTHILIWWVSGDKMLSRSAFRAIRGHQSAGGELIISSISVWEIAMLIEKGRLELHMPLEGWLDQISRIQGIRFMPVDNSICLLSTSLPGSFHKDPADRMIVASARKLGVPLMTADEKILQYPHVKTLQ